MSQSPPERGPQRGNRILRYAVSFVLFVAVMSIPVLLPRFAGHRLGWVLFGTVIAAIAFLVAIPLRWLAPRLPGAASPGIVKPVAGFIACCLILLASAHYARLPSDWIFLIVVVVSLLAMGGVFYYWRALFAQMAGMWGWTQGRQRAIGLAMLGAGIVVQRFMSHTGFEVPLILITAATGSFSARPCPTPPIREGSGQE